MPINEFCTSTHIDLLQRLLVLKQALYAAMAELRTSMIVPVAVRLTAISLRLVEGILPNHHPTSQHEGADRDEQQKLAEIESSSQSSISDKALKKSAEHERQRLCYQRGHHAKPAILPSACLQIPQR